MFALVPERHSFSLLQAEPDPEESQVNVLFCGTSSGGSTFNPDRAGASVFVDAGGPGVLLDCGPGSLERLVRAGRVVEDVAAVLLSHTHHDHVLGVPELVMRRSLLGSSGPPPVYGPAGTADFMKHLGVLVRFLGASRPGDATTDRAAEAQELDPGRSVVFGEMEATPIEVSHAPELQCFGWRVATSDTTVIYSGDTAADPEVMVPFARDADLLIHDAFSAEALAARLEQIAPERRELAVTRVAMTHGDVREVGRIAEAAQVRKLVLTAIFPTEDPESLKAQAAEGFSGPITVAHDGLLVTV